MGSVLLEGKVMANLEERMTGKPNGSVSHRQSVKERGGVQTRPGQESLGRETGSRRKMRGLRKSTHNNAWFERALCC